MNRSRVALFAASMGVMVISPGSMGCRPKVTKAECARLIDRFIDLKLGENPRYQLMAPHLKSAVRAEVIKESANDPDVVQATDKCEEQISHTEYDCGIKAKSSREWNACID